MVKSGVKRVRDISEECGAANGQKGKGGYEVEVNKVGGGLLTRGDRRGVESDGESVWMGVFEWADRGYEFMVRVIGVYEGSLGQGHVVEGGTGGSGRGMWRESGWEAGRRGGGERE